MAGARDESSAGRFERGPPTLTRNQVDRNPVIGDEGMKDPDGGYNL